MHTSSKHLLTVAFGPALRRSTTVPPTFLVPFLLAKSTVSFSTTPSQHASKHSKEESQSPPEKKVPKGVRVSRKDGNHSRGVSALHRRGPKRVYKVRELISRIPFAELPEGYDRIDGEKKLKKWELKELEDVITSSLPKPVLNPAERSKVTVDEDHGLWDFFNEERTALSTPLELSNHGRAWTQHELRTKHWEDLWRLWWVCTKERNRLETFRLEKKRIGGNMYGDYEQEKRSDEIEKTMSAIKTVLTERWYAWENARVEAMEDPEVDLYADPEQGQSAYRPKEEPDLEEETETESASLLPPETPIRPNEARV